MNNKEYNLSFIEAIEKVKSGKYVMIGEQFAYYHYADFDDYGVLSLFSANEHYKKVFDIPITMGLLNQKYRVENILTRKNLE